MASTKAEPWHGQDHKGQCFFHIFIVNPALQTTHSHYFALVPQRLGTNVATTWHDCHARHARHAARIAAQVLARFGCLCFWPCLLGGQLSSTRIQFRFSPSFVRVRLESTQCSHRCLLHVCSARLCFLQTSTPFARISSAPVKQKSVESFESGEKTRCVPSGNTALCALQTTTRTGANFTCTTGSWRCPKVGYCSHQWLQSLTNSIPSPNFWKACQLAALAFTFTFPHFFTFPLSESSLGLPSAVDSEMPETSTITPAAARNITKAARLSGCLIWSLQGQENIWWMLQLLLGEKLFQALHFPIPNLRALETA